MNPKKIFLLFFALYSIFGFYSLPEYGVPLDELTQRFIGIENNRFIAGKTSSESVEVNKYYGPVFESLSYVLEQVIFSQPLRVKLYLRHFVLFSIFLLALYCFYFISLRLFKAKGTAELVTIMLALYPPLFAHAHYNSKDTLFLALTVFCVYYFVKFYESKKLKWIIYMSILIGISTTVRFSGVFILFSIGLGIILWGDLVLKKKINLLITISVISLASFYLVFPLFWVHPIDGWIVLWKYITHNPWPWDELVSGVWVKAGMQPWWYLSAWLCVTIPIVMLVLFFVGLGKIVISKRIYKEILVFVVATLFLVPFVYTTLFHPTLYDGWRHLQFLIVPFSLMAGFGVESLPLKFNNSYKFWVISIYSFIVFAQSHPFQYVYFNEVYRSFVKPNTFTQDYWSLSAKPCVEWIADKDSSHNIVISCFTNSPEMQAIWLGYENTNKFTFTSKEGTGKYEIQIKRDAPFGKLYGKEVFTICPIKDTIARVILLK